MSLRPVVHRPPGAAAVARGGRGRRTLAGLLAALAAVASLPLAGGLARADESALPACTITFVGLAPPTPDGFHNYEQEQNWDPERLPVEDDVACIDTPGAKVLLTINRHVGSLILAPGTTFQLGRNGPTVWAWPMLTVDGVLHNAGTFAVGGQHESTLNVAAFANHGLLDVQRPVGLVRSGGTLRNTGDVVVAEESHLRRASGSILVQAGGSIEAPSPAALPDAGGSTFVYEGGVFDLSGPVPVGHGSTLRFGPEATVPENTEPTFEITTTRLEGPVPAGAVVRSRGSLHQFATAEDGLVNHGTIELWDSPPYGGDLRVEANGTLVNHGTLRVPAGANAANFTGSLDNQGTLELHHDLNLVSVGATHHNSGAVTIADTAKLTTTGSGTTFVQSGGTLDSGVRIAGAGGSAFVYEGGAVAEGGHVRVEHGATLRFGPDVEVPEGAAPAFEITTTRLEGPVPAGAVVRALGGHSQFATAEAGLVNHGTIELWNGGPYGGDLRVEANGTLVNHGTLRVPEAAIGANFTGSLDNQGTLELHHHLNVGSGTLLNVSGATISGGRYLLGADLQLPGPAADIVTNSAELVRLGGTIRRGGVDALTNVSTNQGTFDVPEGVVSVPSSFTNEGTMTVAEGAELVVGGGTGTYEEAGTGTIEGTLTAGSVEVTEEGTMAGSGTLDADVTNGGLVTPGSSPGLLSILGDFVQGPDGVLEIEIEGEEPGTEFDQLDVHGSATLDGTLAAILLGDYSPAPNTSFRVLLTDALTGEFAAVTGGGDSGSFDAAYDTAGVLLSFQSPDATPPAWADGAQLVASAIGTTSLTLTWPAATDDTDVAGYRVRRDGTVVATLGPDVLTHQVTGLAPSTTYTFAVEAFDGADNAASLETQARTTDPAPNPNPNPTPKPNPNPNPNPNPRPGTRPAPRQPSPPQRQWADVPSAAYFAPAVQWAVTRGVTTGVGGSNRFEPHRAATRAEVLTMLWRAAGSPKLDGLAGHRDWADVPRNSYFAPAVRWAVATGVTTGVGGTNRFEPHRPATRAEVLTMLWRSVGAPAETRGRAMTDVPRGAWFAPAVRWATTNGVTTGLGGSNRFGPEGTATRADTLTFIWRVHR